MHIQELALAFLDDESKYFNLQVDFKKDKVSFSDDGANRRHSMKKFLIHGAPCPNHFSVIREDGPNDGVFLCVINLNHCKVLSIKENYIEFEDFTFSYNPT